MLEDGRRVLTQSDVMRVLGRARQAKGRAYYDADVNLPAFLTAKNLTEFVDKDLYVTSSQVVFKPLKGVKAFGYPAELLPKVCEVFLKARDAGVLKHTQLHIAKQADNRSSWVTHNPKPDIRKTKALSQTEPLPYILLPAIPSATMRLCRTRRRHRAEIPKS